MQKVFEDFDLTRVGHMQSVLEAAGIATLFKNQFMSSVMGEIPFVEVMPELWVVDDRDVDRARSLLQPLLIEPTEPAPEWTCEDCGTQCSGVFSHCWKCGAAAGELTPH